MLEDLAQDLELGGPGLGARGHGVELVQQRVREMVLIEPL
jgi:hypothetical protein